jgi:hypothetical protein
MDQLACSFGSALGTSTRRMDALPHALALPRFCAEQDGLMVLHVATFRAGGIKDSKAVKNGGEQHAARQSRPPEHEAGLWDWRSMQDVATVTGLLAYRAVRTAEPARSGRRQRCHTQERRYGTRVLSNCLRMSSGSWPCCAQSRPHHRRSGSQQDAHRGQVSWLSAMLQTV